MAVKRKTTQEVSAPTPAYRAPSEESSLKNMVGMITGNLGTVLLIVAAFLIGMLWSEVKYLRKGAPTAATTTSTGTTQTQQAAGPSITQDQITLLENGDNLFFGEKGSDIFFLKVSDPSCAFCQIASGENPTLNKEAGAQFTMVSDGGTYVPPLLEMRKLVEAGEASFAWLYYPGSSGGEVAALALYCANDQEKFWEAHDLLMSAEGFALIKTVLNDRTKSGDMANFLSSVANATEIKNCIDGGKYDARLISDQTTAQTLGIGGTPLFFVNTTAFPGAYSFTDMASAL